ncbi:MAG: 50S ribosomal protein L18 [Parcubacteria group bacterium ADurb.Bin316]|nr:MAG: 50S ribosomal protein L18 [Parcubacteria group bacterium ADurb.Bin316]HOZ56077.1 50S ribosomal protein L18 [bacterium]
MNKEKSKLQKRTRRQLKIRAKISGTAKCPRLSVFKSNTGMYLQLIDDTIGKTLVSAHSREVKLGKNSNKENMGRKVSIGFELGKIIAERAKNKKIAKIVFDRGGHRYHGRVKSAADGARAGGLEF